MAMIVYTGSEPELEIEAGVNWWVTVTPGVAADIPDVLAHGCEQHGEPGDADYQCARLGLLARDDFELADSAPVTAPAPTIEAPAPEQEG